MIGIRNNIITLLLTMCMLLASVQIALASEITGTLSSDGSAASDSGVVLGETVSTNDDEVSGQVAQQNSGQIQGSVVQGREESTAEALVEPSSWNTSTWAIPLTVVVLAGLIYFFWRRQMI